MKPLFTSALASVAPTSVVSFNAHRFIHRFAEPLDDVLLADVHAYTLENHRLEYVQLCAILREVFGSNLYPDTYADMGKMMANIGFCHSLTDGVGVLAHEFLNALRYATSLLIERIGAGVFVCLVENATELMVRSSKGLTILAIDDELIKKLSNAWEDKQAGKDLDFDTLNA